MKNTIERIRVILEAANWSTQYRYPDTWNEKDQDKCINKLSAMRVPFSTVSDVLDEYFQEILLEWYERGNDTDFELLAAQYIADVVAGEMLSKRKDVYYPDSATFHIVF